MNYENDYLVLMHDEAAYKDLFEEKFPAISTDEGGQLKL